MGEVLASLQPLVVGVTFVGAGAWKVFSPRAGEVAARSALALVFRGEAPARRVHRLLGLAELALGLLLLGPPTFPWETRCAAALTAAFVGYLIFAMRAAPDRPCGCLGGRETRVSGRTLGRAVFLLLSALLGGSTDRHWLTTATTAPWALGGAALELLFLARLSPELDGIWTLRPRFRRTTPQASGEPECATARVSLPDSLRQLRRSAAFRAAARFLTSDLTDHWRDGCWRFLCFEAEYEGRKATAVFAVPILDSPHKVRAAIVDEVHGATLWTFPPDPAQPQSA